MAIVQVIVEEVLRRESIKQKKNSNSYIKYKKLLLYTYICGCLFMKCGLLLFYFYVSWCHEERTQEVLQVIMYNTIEQDPHVTYIN